jgi:hypothetical protein
MNTIASPGDGVQDTPVRLKATSPTCPSLRESAPARITAALALKNSVGSPAASMALNGSHVRLDDHGNPQPWSHQTTFAVPDQIEDRASPKRNSF